ncbi:RcnB family protein [Sphingopyxis sp. BSNA05]|uniref:RcnB family protein n=1 Tax=Sphingopyxis sp. BSNA05 TaxID=1236614 RepID=UPI00349F80EA
MDRRYDRNNNGRVDRRVDRDRDGRIDRRYRDNRQARNNRNYNRSNRDWNRNWRQDRRYDWRRYRQANRSYYRLGRYYSPYRSHSYRRWNIGVFLGTSFYGSRYWINDPWRYRLPTAYAGTRWIRYYDDVLLVDTYSGEVIDVIYDFFW